MSVVFTKAPFEDDWNVDHWPRWMSRYFDIYQAIKMGNPVVNTIFKHAPWIDGPSTVLVDVRLQYLEPGYYSSRPAWHVDLPDDPGAAIHIYTIGEARTEFRMDDDTTVFHPPGHYATYTPTDWHRAVEAPVEEFRLFVRMIQTNRVEKKNRKGLFTYYPYRYPVGGKEFAEDEDVVYNRYDEKKHLNRGAR